MLEQGESMRSAPTEEEGATEITSDELITAPMPCPADILEGRRKRIQKRSPGRREGWGKAVVKIWFSVTQLWFNWQ